MAAQCLQPTVRTTRVPSDNLVSELVEPAPVRLPELVPRQRLRYQLVPGHGVPEPVAAGLLPRPDPDCRPATTTTADDGGAVA